MKNYSLLTDIMINKQSKFILTARKGNFFFLLRIWMYCWLCAKECVQQSDYINQHMLELSYYQLHWTGPECPAFITGIIKKVNLLVGLYIRFSLYFLNIIRNRFLTFNNILEHQKIQYKETCFIIEKRQEQCILVLVFGLFLNLRNLLLVKVFFHNCK